MVREIYSLRETLTKNFEVNSTNLPESNQRTNIRRDERKGENYIPLGINAGGIKSKNNKINSFSKTNGYIWLNFGTEHQWNIGIQNCKIEKKSVAEFCHSDLLSVYKFDFA